MRGEIIDYVGGAASGLISGEDGRRYTFADADIVRRDGFVGLGVKVDFVADGERATQIYCLAEKPGLPFESTNEDLGLWEYFTKCMRLYANGDGRARRKEYWSFILFSWLFALAGLVVVALLCMPFIGSSEEPARGASILIGLVAILAVVAFVIAFLPPSYAVLSRRLHDVGMSGWFALLSLIPYLGGFFVLVISLIPSQEATNRYGPYPKPRAPYPV